MSDAETRYAALKAKLDAAPDATEVETPVEPAAEAAPESTPEANAAPPEGEAAAKAEELFPGYSALSDDARAKIDEIVHQRDDEHQNRLRAEQDAKRYRNQVLPIQRKLTALEQQRSAPAPVTVAAPKAPQSAEQSRLERFRSELPDETAAFEELSDAKISPLKAQLDELKDALAHEQAKAYRAELEAELTSEDPHWLAKTKTTTFDEWAGAFGDTNSEFYDPVMAETIDRARKLERGAAIFVLRQFNRDLADYEAGREAPKAGKPAPQVRRPIPDPSPRRSAVAVTEQPKEFASDQERRLYEWKRKQGVA